MELIGLLVVVLAVLGIVGYLLIEWQYRQRPGNDLELSATDWRFETYEPGRYALSFDTVFTNRTRTLEIFIPEVDIDYELLSSSSLEGISVKTEITPAHEDFPARADNYWFAYIVKVGKATQAKIKVDITGPDLSQLKSLWVKVNYLTYGPEGRIPKTGHLIAPLKFPNPQAANSWRETSVAHVLPIPTHLLTNLDNTVDIVKKYVAPCAQPGDIVTIGETPVAIMQNRLRHPTTVKPGWLAKRLCYYFMSTSSLATACGMQTLIDVSGPWQVGSAFVLGAIAKIFGSPGMFYHLAGEQARLIDDVTGTLPPFDQFIVLGPNQSQQLVDKIFEETGLKAAIVDVNDLKAVKILAKSENTDEQLLIQALLDNPAGNADEQTPVVLIRPRA
ncbi:F420-0:Gamma-glutamyl ligase [cf. Phormidesmis sp. LEGE 11477]|uniref:F420-0:Gamma-glutamyl ligase n=1 Tax=cf. Phormidesmis sp. LEGE 11477 TaxID=1828680 RepID=UPI00187F9646|nr:F420-0:Gamma-glutamyl ligase [cf. Phormidesmis sp. LEGE 11477]MBE9062740.1 F420-0:Gamma-glutamyl ligase [cf. Phormidesmis sp. LEGE 11477]